MADENVPLNEHPLLRQLGQRPEDAVAILGYVRPSEDGKRVTVFARLDSLEESVDIEASDVLATADAPESVLPLRGTMLWIKKGAHVTYRHVVQRTLVPEQLPVSFTQSQKTISPRVPGGLELQRGRLRMRIPAQPYLPRRCVNDCVSGCVCTSRCETAPPLPCVSGCG